MAYDNTNFYGDLIVSEYDDKGNFMTPQTPTGYYVYHILGDGFDLMSEMCNQFMNDFSILTASTKGLDNFWGVSYNMPRPLLYEGQRADYLFVDNGTTASHNSNMQLYQGVRTITDTGTLLETDTNNRWDIRPNNFGLFDTPFSVEFDVVDTSNRVAIYLYNNSNGVIAPWDSRATLQSGDKIKVEVGDTNANFYVNDVLRRTMDYTSTSKVKLRIFFNVANNYLKYKNFKIYTGEDKERHLTDEEYKIYLYLRNCRLMTREDIEINMNKCFAVENENSQYPIFFSTETNYLSVVNHLSYDSKTTEESNLAKNDEDTSLNFITNFASDEDTLTIESGLSEVEEVIEVINVPSPNGYDPAFLELLENYISVKGNLKIKEYSI